MKVSINSSATCERLDQLPVGAEACLGTPEHTTPTILRLMEMGLTQGTRVRMTRLGPFGDPLEVEVRGTRLCLRTADARAFPLQPATAGAAPAEQAP